VGWGSGDFTSGYKGLNYAYLQRIGANWPILSPNQAISSLSWEQNNPIMLIMLMPMMPMG
jgi:hypothetical protein